jgi:hypothetical protein
MAKRKFKAVVVFGETAANAYGWEDMKKMCSLVRGGEGSLSVREFDTEAERRAYILGIDDADGWLGAAVLSDKDARKKCVRNLLNE